MKTKLINLFRDPFNIFLAIGITLGVILSIWLYNSTGSFTPPNETDFAELHKQKEIILEDFEKVYDLSNAKIYPNEEETIVKLISEKNSDFILELTFTKQKEFVEYKEISQKMGYRTYPIIPLVDKTSPYIWTGISGFLIGVVIAFFMQIVYAISAWIYYGVKDFLKK